VEIEQLQQDIPGVTIDVVARQGDRLSTLIGQDSYSYSYSYSYSIANIYIGAQDEAELTEKYHWCVQALRVEIDEEIPSTA
jgi:hypothetical protein